MPRPAAPTTPAAAPGVTPDHLDEVPSSQPDLDDAIMNLSPSFDALHRPVDSSAPLRAAVDALPSPSVPASQPVAAWAFVSPAVAVSHSPVLSASIAASIPLDWTPTPRADPPSAAATVDPRLVSPPTTPAPEATPAHVAAPAPAPAPGVSSFERQMLFEAALTDARETTARVSDMTASINHAAAVLASVADVLAEPASPAPSTGPGADWARQPDRSPTAQDIALAQHVIAHGQSLTIHDFSSSIPTVPEASVPLPADHEEWLPVAPSSERSLQVSALATAFPSLQEHLYVLALELNTDLPSARLWLSGLLRGQADVPALKDAFPDASPDEISAAFVKSAGGFRAAFWTLASKHKSAWAPAAVGPSPNLGAMAGIDEVDAEFYGEGQDFSGASQSHSLPESRWWTATLASRASRFSDNSRESDLWPKVTMACANKVAISPRTLAYMRRLACMHTAPWDFREALLHLQALPSFSRVFTVNITHENAIHVNHILLSLLRGGLISPGACAWLAEYSSQDPLAYSAFCRSAGSFPARFQAIWKGRNAALHRWRRATIYGAVDESSHPSRDPPAGFTDSDGGDVHGSVDGAPPGSSVGVSRHSPSFRGSLASEPYLTSKTVRKTTVLRHVPRPPPVVEVPPRAPGALSPIIELSPDDDIVDLTGDPDVIDLTIEDVRNDAALAHSLGLHPEGTLDGSVAGPSDLTSKGKKRRSGPMLTEKAARRARLLKLSKARDAKSKGQTPPPPYADPSQEC